MDGNRKTGSALALYFESAAPGLVHLYTFDWDRDAYAWQGLVDHQPGLRVLELKIGDRSDR